MSALDPNRLDALSGRAFVAHNAVAAVGGLFAMVAFVNPAGSSQNLVLTRFAATIRLRLTLIVAAIGSPLLSNQGRSMLSFGPAPVAEIRGGAVGVVTGTLVEDTVVAANSGRTLDLPYVIAPGGALKFSAVAASVPINGLSIEWVEVPG